MNGIDRLKELIEGGAPTYRGSPMGVDDKDRRIELLAIFPDGTKEFKYPEFPITRPVSGGGRYAALVRILEKEDVEPQLMKIKSQIHAQWHVLELPNGETYRSLLPSLRYINR
ncbi:MAG: hypothetical protein HY516_03465 [Candidatus Aenigmarchaeota archaeon]|nr:hypothetical protein [Candidatus Aenigmarchaeota archaeon]